MRYTPNLTLTDPKTGEEETVHTDIHIGCTTCSKSWVAEEATVAQECPVCSSKAISENREISHFSIYIAVDHLLSVSEPYRKETLYAMAVEFLEKQGHSSPSKNEIQLAVDENGLLAVCTPDLKVHYVVRTAGQIFKESQRETSEDLTPLEEISDTNSRWPKGQVQRIEPYLANLEKWIRIIHDLLDNQWEFKSTGGHDPAVDMFFFKRTTHPTQEFSFEQVLEEYMKQVEEY